MSLFQRSTSKLCPSPPIGRHSQEAIMEYTLFLTGQATVSKTVLIIAHPIQNKVAGRTVVAHDSVLIFATVVVVVVVIIRTSLRTSIYTHEHQPPACHPIHQLLGSSMRVKIFMYSSLSLKMNTHAHSPRVAFSTNRNAGFKPAATAVSHARATAVQSGARIV